MIKRLIIFLVFLLGLCMYTHAIAPPILERTSQTPVVGACADTTCVGFSICQNAEGVGYDNSESWSESGAVDEDSTNVILRGTQSIELINTGGQTVATQFNLGSGFAELSGHTLYNTANVPATADGFALLMRNTSQSGVVSLYIRSVANGQVFRLVSGAVTCNPSAQYAADTDYHIWWHVKNDGTADMQFGTSTNPALAIDSCTIGSGGTTDSIQYLDLRNSGTSAVTSYYDQILLRATAIGEVCE